MKNFSTRMGLAFLLSVMMGAVFLTAFGSRGLSAQQSMGPAAADDSVPPDVHPDTRARMGLATRSELTSPEDLAAWDHLLAMEPGFAHRENRAMGGTSIRMHIPVVADAYRTAWNDLLHKNDVDPKYMDLAILVACRETSVELEWVAHEKEVAKLDSPEIVEMLRYNREPKGLDEKQDAIVHFGREMFRNTKVSSATFERMQKDFGPRQTLAITLMMGYYANNAFLFRAYDQRLDKGTPRPFPDIVAREKKEKY